MRTGVTGRAQNKCTEILQRIGLILPNLGRPHKAQLLIQQLVEIRRRRRSGKANFGWASPAKKAGVYT